MDMIYAAYAGVLATGVMTFLVYLAPFARLPRVDPFGVLGFALTPRVAPAYALGIFGHFALGAVFAILYAVAWELGPGRPTWGWGVLFGAVHGAIALAAIPGARSMHPRPGGMPPLTPGTIAVVGVSHLVYGLMVGLTYQALLLGPDPLPAT